VASIAWLLSLGVFPLRLAVAGPAADAFGTRLPLLAGAVWILASTAIVLAVPNVRELRLQDAPPPASARSDEVPAGRPDPVTRPGGAPG
jgi:MFS family permease